MPGVTYFGEKPLLTDKRQLKALDSCERFFCDFIETESRVVRTLQRVIGDSDFEISKLSFWRLGSTALKKIFDPETRTGVTGGALVDKTPHDLSITLALLGGDRPDKLQADVMAASVYSFLPAYWPSLVGSTPVLLSGKDLPMTRITSGFVKQEGEDWTADGGGWARVRWRDAANGPIEAEHFFSWIGVREFENISTSKDSPVWELFSLNSA